MEHQLYYVSITKVNVLKCSVNSIEVSAKLGILFISGVFAPPIQVVSKHVRSMTSHPL